MQYDVFISYSRKDIAAAETLCRALDEAGVKYWIDRNMHGSVNFLSEITRYIRNAKAVLFIASDNSAKSEWTQKEILFAIKHNKKIVPYRIGDFRFEDNDELDFVFANVQWEHSVEAVVDTLQKLGLVTEKRTTHPSQPSQASKTTTTKSKWLWVLALLPLSLIGLWFGFFSETDNGVYQVGDFYNVDGCQGVVFEVDATGMHGKIVSLKQSSRYLHWCSDSEFVRRQSVYADDEYNGLRNQQKVQQLSNWQKNYPPFAWCAAMGERWYLPAVDELIQIRKNKALINATLADVGGDALSIYWASTEGEYEGNRGWRFCAWYVDMENDYANDVNKGYDFYVRAVTTF